MDICIKVELQKWILWLSLMKIHMDISLLHLLKLFKLIIYFYIFNVRNIGNIIFYNQSRQKGIMTQIFWTEWKLPHLYLYY